MTPRVVRLDEVAEPERAAPVASFGGDPVHRSDPAADRPGMFDRLDAPAAAPVAPVGEADDHGTTAAGAAEVADIAGLDAAPAAVFRAAELTGLAPGGRGRRSATPGGRSPRRRAAVPRPDAAEPPGPAPRSRPHAAGRTDPVAPIDPVGPPDGNEATGTGSRGRGRSEDRSARRGGGGFGSRGRPAELDPDADPVAAAKEIYLRLLSDRARTRQELAQALARKGVPDEVADGVLERFDEVGLIDDAAFAGQWVRSRHNHRGLARRAIAMELRRKGVDDEVASEALEEVDQESEERRARELVDRKLRTVPADTPELRKKAATRLVGMLARKGYGGGVAYRVVREALAAHGAEIDELGTDPVD